MRAKILAVVVILGAGYAAVGEEAAPMPKEGSYSSTSVGSNALKVLPMGKDRLQITWEYLGASLSDDGKGPTHAASVRCLGSVHAVNGEYQNFTNSCVFTRPDGDQIFSTEAATGKVGAASKGTATFTGGTGKMSGITGGYEFTRIGVRPAVEGTGQFITRSKMSYKLP